MLVPKPARQLSLGMNMIEYGPIGLPLLSEELGPKALAERLVC